MPIQVIQEKRLLAVDGNDVMAILGLKAGPEVGKVLNKLMNIVAYEPEKNNREELLEIISKNQEADDVIVFVDGGCAGCLWDCVLHIGHLLPEK